MNYSVNSPEYLIIFKSKMDIIKNYEKQLFAVSDPVLYVLISDIMYCMRDINFFLLSIVELDPIILFFKELFSHRFSKDMRKRNIINILIHSGIYFNWKIFFPYFFEIHNAGIWFSIIEHLVRNHKYCEKYLNYYKNNSEIILFSIINKSYFFSKLNNYIINNIKMKISDIIFDISIINNELEQYYLQYCEWILEIKKIYIILLSSVRQNKINRDIACIITTYFGNNMKGTTINIQKSKMDSLIYLYR